MDQSGAQATKAARTSESQASNGSAHSLQSDASSASTEGLRLPAPEPSSSPEVDASLTPQGAGPASRLTDKLNASLPAYASPKAAAPQPLGLLSPTQAARPAAVQSARPLQNEADLAPREDSTDSMLQHLQHASSSEEGSLQAALSQHQQNGTSHAPQAGPSPQLGSTAASGGSIEGASQEAISAQPGQGSARDLASTNPATSSMQHGSVPAPVPLNTAQSGAALQLRGEQQWAFNMRTNWGESLSAAPSGVPDSQGAANVLLLRLSDAASQPAGQPASQVHHDRAADLLAETAAEPSTPIYAEPHRPGRPPTAAWRQQEQHHLASEHAEAGSQVIEYHVQPVQPQATCTTAGTGNAEAAKGADGAQEPLPQHLSMPAQPDSVAVNQASAGASLCSGPGEGHARQADANAAATQPADNCRMLQSQTSLSFEALHFGQSLLSPEASDLSGSSAHVPAQAPTAAPEAAVSAPAVQPSATSSKQPVPAVVSLDPPQQRPSNSQPAAAAAAWDCQPGRAGCPRNSSSELSPAVSSLLSPRHTDDLDHTSEPALWHQQPELSTAQASGYGPTWVASEDLESHPAHYRTSSEEVEAKPLPEIAGAALLASAMQRTVSSVMQAAAKAKQKKLARSMTTTHALFSSHLARSSGAPRFSGTTRRPISPASRTGSANAALLVHQSSLGSYSDSKLASGSTSRRTGTPNSARQPAAGTTRKLAAPGGSSQTGPRRKLQLDSAGSGLFNVRTHHALLEATSLRTDSSPQDASRGSVLSVFSTAAPSVNSEARPAAHQTTAPPPPISPTKSWQAKLDATPKAPGLWEPRSPGRDGSSQDASPGPKRPAWQPVLRVLPTPVTGTPGGLISPSAWPDLGPLTGLPEGRRMSSARNTHSRQPSLVPAATTQPTMASDGQASPHALVQQLSQLAELLQAESIRQSMDGAPPASGPDAASQAQPSEEYADSGVSPRSTQDLLMTIEAQGAAAAPAHVGTLPSSKQKQRASFEGKRAVPSKQASMRSSPSATAQPQHAPGDSPGSAGMKGDRQMQAELAHLTQMLVGLANQQGLVLPKELQSLASVSAQHQQLPQDPHQPQQQQQSPSIVSIPSSVAAAGSPHRHSSAGSASHAPAGPAHNRVSASGDSSNPEHSPSRIPLPSSAYHPAHAGLASVRSSLDSSPSKIPTPRCNSIPQVDDVTAQPMSTESFTRPAGHTPNRTGRRSSEDAATRESSPTKIPFPSTSTSPESKTCQPGVEPSEEDDAYTRMMRGLKAVKTAIPKPPPPAKPRFWVMPKSCLPARVQESGGPDSNRKALQQALGGQVPFAKEAAPAERSQQAQHGVPQASAGAAKADACAPVSDKRDVPDVSTNSSKGGGGLPALAPEAAKREAEAPRLIAAANKRPASLEHNRDGAANNPTQLLASGETSGAAGVANNKAGVKHGLAVGDKRPIDPQPQDVQSARGTVAAPKWPAKLFSCFMSRSTV